MKRRIVSLVISLVAAILISLPIYILEEGYQREHNKDTHLTASRELARIKEVIQADLQSSLNYAHFLELIIQQNPDFTVEDFEIYAEMITAENDFVSSAVFAPNGVVEFIYPGTDRSKQFIGQDLLNDPGKKLSAQYALKNRTAVIQGPIKEAGTLMVYNRQPIFIGDEFYGFVSISVNFYELLEAHDIKEKKGDLLLALQVNSPFNPEPSAVTWGSMAIFDKNPEKEVLQLSGEEWVLAAYPISGWDNIPEQLLPKHFPFYLVLVVLFILFYHLVMLYWKRRQEAFYDGLTQTLNKKRFENYVKLQWKNSNGKGTLLLIDLNDFKCVNDKFGHAAGDYVLTTISERLRGALRKSDKVGRVGGDEFMVYLQDIRSEEHLMVVTNKVRDSLTKPIAYHNHQLFVHVSIGWAFANGDSAFEDIYSQADKNMYKEKVYSKRHYSTENV